MFSKNTKISKKFILISAFLAIAVLLAGTLYYFRIHSRDSNVSTNPVTEKPEINYGPPTQDEKEAANAAKKRIVEKEAQLNSSNIQPGLKQVSLVITNATKKEINVYVQGVFEDNGVCTATFTQGTSKVTRTSIGFANVSYTQCAPISPNLPTEGSWSFVVSYNSATAQGVSQSTGVKQ